jgi:4-hydroxythreonine-4-phosphate dehydrogenase
VLFIKKAVELAQLGCIDGMVTAPINKEAINMAGCHFPGHTELLADLTKTEESGMMIIGGPLRIMFVTTHADRRRNMLRCCALRAEAYPSARPK